MTPEQGIKSIDSDTGSATSRRCVHLVLRNRQLLVLIAPLLVLLSAVVPALDLQVAVRAVDTVGFTVSEMDRSVKFFSEVLSFEKVAESTITDERYDRLQGLVDVRMRIVRMRLGEESIELTQYLAPRGRPIPVDSRSNDRWFQHIAIIVSDMDRAYAWLRRHQVEHSSPGPQRLPDWNTNAAGIRAFYFKDPDGHPLEILQFPPNKGAAKWHVPSDRLFLGIDHTAIVVHDTNASLALYRDVLGLRVVGESENYGIEQEHLNNVQGARLRITSVRAPAGPGIEFLEYLAPRDGRPLPPDLRANDIAHWQVRLIAAEAQRVSEILQTTMVRFVSPGWVETPSAELGFRTGALVRDPDGHALQIVSDVTLPP